MFASSFELWDRHCNIVWQRRLMPVLSLPREFLDASGKVFALLWQIWLMVGPDPYQVLHFCERVRCIVSDMGTERLIARFVDILPDMFEVMLNTKTQLRHRPFLLPLCLCSPGWMHGWDIVLRRCLSGMKWFPVWLEGVRSIVSSFRTKLLVASLCKRILQAGYEIISSMVSDVSMPSIAEWRWCTLFEACKSLKSVIGTLRSHWDPNLFKNAQDPVTIKKASSAIASRAWSSDFEFVLRSL